jgi:hypothetical protein
MTDESNETIKPGPQPIDFAKWMLTSRRGIDVEIDEVFHERAEAVRQLHNANRINNELTEAITKVSRENERLRQQEQEREQRPAFPAALGELLARLVRDVDSLLAAQERPTR